MAFAMMKFHILYCLLSFRFHVDCGSLILEDNNKIGCYLDLNGDRFTDIAVINNMNVEVRSWNNKKKEFQPITTITLSHTVVRVIAGNFGGDVIDLITIEEVPPNTYKMQVWFKNKNDHKFTQQWEQNDLYYPDILLFDAEANIKSNVLYMTATQQHKVMITKNNDFKVLNDIDADINTFSWIDINQDCKADLVFYHKNKGMYYINGGNNENVDYWKRLSSLSAVQEISSMTQTQLQDHDPNSIVFADFNLNGDVDILFKDSNHLKLYFYLKQNPVKDRYKLCAKQIPPVFKKINIDLPTELNDYTWYSSANTFMLVADLDLDQKMEIILLLEKDGFVNIVIVNFNKNSNTISIKEDPDNVKLTGWNQIDQISYYHNGDFPNGRFLAVHGKRSSNDPNFKTEFLEIKYNSNSLSKKDVYFLTICPLDVKKDQKSDNDYQYSHVFNGVTIKAYFHDDSGKIKFLTSSTRYQTNQKTMSLPCAIMGLGHTSGYIERLMISYPLHTSQDYYYLYSQPGVPPNSELYLFPDPPNHPASWRLESFLSPQITWQVLAIILTVICGILGGILIYLDQKQRKENKKEYEMENPAMTNKFFF